MVISKREKKMEESLGDDWYGGCVSLDKMHPIAVLSVLLFYHEIPWITAF